MRKMVYLDNLNKVVFPKGSAVRFINKVLLCTKHCD